MGHRSLPQLLRRALPLAAVGLAVLAPAALGDVISPESGGSSNADAIDDLYWMILAIAAIVFVGVEGILFYSLWKFRARRGRIAAQIHGNTQLEIGWTWGAAVILVFITAFTFIKLDDIRTPAATSAAGFPVPVISETHADRDQPSPPGGKALQIKVDGQQYVWRYAYPALDVGGLKNAEVFAYEEMVVPVNTTVVLDVTADDVAHSWWIPKLGGKVDALPGYTNRTWFKITKPGVYDGQCAELCGRNHANMLARVRAVSVDEFKQWYTGKAQDIKTARSEQARQREAIQRERGE